MLTSDAVSQFLEAKRSDNRRPATLAYYDYELARLVRSCAELPLQPQPIRRVLASVGGADSSRHATFRAFRALYRWLVREELIPSNPMTRIDPPEVGRKRQRTLDRPEVARLLAFARDELSPRDRAILTLILDTGIRSGEARSLVGRDLRDGYVVVRGKTGERAVPVHPETLMQLRLLARAPDEAIFRTLEGKALSRWRLYRIVSGALELVKLASQGKHGAHLLRHTFGRHWIVAKGSLPGLKQVMGHASITTTMLYVDLAGTEVEREFAECSQLTRGQEGLRRVV